MTKQTTTKMVVRKKPGTKPKAQDPSKPIRCARHEAFAQSLFTGKLSQADAFRKHYPHSTKWKDSSVHSKAAQLVVKVRQRVDWLNTQVISSKIMTKEEMGEMLTRMAITTPADFLEVDQDGELFVKVTKETMGIEALKKCKVRRITDENGNQVLGIHLTDFELVDKIAILKALADLFGYNKPDVVEHTGEITVVNAIPDPDPPPKE